MKTRVAQVVLIIVGLLILAYPLTLGADPDVTCRGQVLQPGDVCAKADGSETQTYEERAKAVSNARPVIIVAGVVLTGFGVVLLAGEVRRSRRTDGRLRERRAS